MVNEQKLSKEGLINTSQLIDLGNILNQSIKTKNEIILLDIIETISKNKSRTHIDLQRYIEDLQEALDSARWAAESLEEMI